MAGWQWRRTSERRLAAEEPDAHFRFPRGRARDECTPGGLSRIALLFMLVGAGFGALAGRGGFEPQLFAGGWTAAFGLEGQLAPVGMTVVGAFVGLAAMMGFGLCWTCKDSECRARRLAWGLWGLIAVVLPLRFIGDWLAYYAGSVAPLREDLLAGPALSAAVAALAFFTGVAIHHGLEYSRYDHDERHGPFGGTADWHRSASAFSFVVYCVLLGAAFWGWVLLVS